MEEVQEFLSYIKKEASSLLQNKKNLVNLLVLAILVLAIPLGVNLIKQQQILKSKAVAPPIVFAGSNVKTINNKLIATKNEINLEITAPDETGAGSSAGSSGGQGNGGQSSGGGSSSGGSSSGGSSSGGSSSGGGGSSGGSGSGSSGGSFDVFQSRIDINLNGEQIAERARQVMAGRPWNNRQAQEDLRALADKIFGKDGEWITPEQVKRFGERRPDIGDYIRRNDDPNSSNHWVRNWFPGGSQDVDALNILLGIIREDNGKPFSALPAGQHPNDIVPNALLAMAGVKESLISMNHDPEGSRDWPASCFLREWFKIAVVNGNDPNARKALEIMRQTPKQLGFDDAAIRKGCDRFRGQTSSIFPFSLVGTVYAGHDNGCGATNSCPEKEYCDQTYNVLCYDQTDGSHVCTETPCGQRNDQCNPPGAPSGECITKRCPNGDPCAAGHKYCRYGDAGNYWSECIQEVDNCAQQCVTTQPKKYGCVNGSCQEKAGGSFSDASCGGTCSGGGGNVTCNDISMSVLPGSSSVGQQLSFNISGDASTFLDDNYQGAVKDCSGEWNSKKCTADKTGNFTWTHTWKKCEGSTSNCSPQCSKSASFTIGGATPTITSFRIAETPDGLDSAPKKDYNRPGPVVISAFKFSSDTPGTKTIFVQFYDKDDKKVGERRQASIELLSPSPAITGCSLSFEGSNVVFEISGSNFGSDKGSVVSEGTTLQVRDWKANKVKAFVSNPQTGKSFPIKVTDSFERSAESTCAGVSTLSVGANYFCRAPQNTGQSNMELVIVEDTPGATPVKQKVSIDRDGVVGGLTANLVAGKKYKVSLKAPRSVRRKADVTASSGTTNVPNFVLPVGDIFPRDSGDGKINSLDKAELNRQWVVAVSASGRSGDFNQDGRVNSIDWACMRQDFGQEDDAEPTAPPAPAGVGTTNPVGVGGTSP